MVEGYELLKEPFSDNSGVALKRKVTFSINNYEEYFTYKKLLQIGILLEDTDTFINGGGAIQDYNPTHLEDKLVRIGELTKCFFYIMDDIYNNN